MFSHSRALEMSTVPILIAEDDRKNIVIDRPTMVVGRSRRRSDIRIDDRSISAVHCEIEIGENCLQVRNRGRNGIRINGQKSDKGVLRDGDVFEIARMKYRVLMQGDSAYPNTSRLSHSNDWFARLAGMELGPMPWAELSLMAQRGELTRSDEVRWSRQRNWRPAATADDLFDSESEDSCSSPSPGTSDFGQAFARKEDVSTTNDDDQRQVIEFASAEFDLDDETSNSTPRDAGAMSDTAAGFLDKTTTSVSSFNLIEPCREDAAAVPDPGSSEEQDAVDGEWRLEDTPAEQSDDFESEVTSAPSLVANRLPALPVPPPLPASPSLSTQPLPSSQKLPPISNPKIGRSDRILDVVYDNVLEPVFDRVPILLTWPGVAAVIAVVSLLVVMMFPSYEGAEVSGLITLNGQPLTGATISFTDLKNGFGASAIVGSDGTFQVVTLKGGMKPGTYSVAVMPLEPESQEVVSELQRQFSESKNGGLHNLELMTGEGEGERGDQPGRSSEEAEEEWFELPSTTIPFNYRSIQTSDISMEITEDGSNELLIELATNDADAQL